jgi:hypothetical protein
MKIAFDIGGVIVNRRERKPIDEAYNSIKLFVEKFKSDNIFIISKAKSKYIDINLKLLNDTDFYNITGFDKKNIYFVNEYYEKAPLCKKLEIDYLIDDSVKIIRSLLDTSTIPIWFNPKDETCLKHKRIIVVYKWKSIRKLCSKIS